MKRLIINADDFGLTRDVNAGIIHAHRMGVLTSTTLMANGNAYDDATWLIRETPSLDVGAHLVLIQGRSLLTGRAYPANPAQLLAALATRQLNVYAELKAQIQKLLSSGVYPTHLDSHKHTHLVPAIFRVVAALAQEFSIPYVRLPLDRSVPFSHKPADLAARYFRKIAAQFNVRMTDHFIGFRLTGKLNEDTLIDALRNLPEGTTEFMCHPGFVGPELQKAPTRLKESRLRELQALTSPRVRRLLAAESIHLEAFGRADSFRAAR